MTQYDSFGNEIPGHPDNLSFEDLLSGKYCPITGWTLESIGRNSYMTSSPTPGDIAVSQSNEQKKMDRDAARRRAI